MSVGSFRTLSSVGFVAGVACASLVALGARSPWWLDLPAILGPAVAAVAFVLHAWAVRKDRMREELGAYVLAAFALLPYGLGAPSATAWSLSALAAGGFLFAIEAAAAARRLAKLEAAEGREAHVDRVAKPLRTALLLPLLAIVAILVVARPVGKAVLGLPGDALGDSLEAAGLYGTALGALLVAGLLALAAYVRHAREDAA